jgi:ketosteroid isomerase-like protein
MSEENVEWARAAYAHPDGLAALEGQVAPGAEFDFSSAYPDRPLLRGVDAMREFREQGPWAEIHFEPERFIDVDDERVLVLVRVSLVGQGSGAAVERSAAHLVTRRGGLVTGFKAYLDRGEALRDCGLGG